MLIKPNLAGYGWAEKMLNSSFNGMGCEKCGHKWYNFDPCCAHPALTPTRTKDIKIKKVYVTNFSIQKMLNGFAGEVHLTEPELPYQTFHLNDEQRSGDE